MSYLVPSENKGQGLGIFYGGRFGWAFYITPGPYVTGNFNILPRGKDRDEEVSKTVAKGRPEKIEK